MGINKLNTSPETKTDFRENLNTKQKKDIERAKVILNEIEIEEKKEDDKIKLWRTFEEDWSGLKAEENVKKQIYNLESWVLIDWVEDGVATVSEWDYIYIQNINGQKIIFKNTWGEYDITIWLVKSWLENPIEDYRENDFIIEK